MQKSKTENRGNVVSLNPQIIKIENYVKEALKTKCNILNYLLENTSIRREMKYMKTNINK